MVGGKTRASPQILLYVVLKFVYPRRGGPFGSVQTIGCHRARCHRVSLPREPPPACQLLNAKLDEEA